MILFIETIFKIVGDDVLKRWLIVLLVIVIGIFIFFRIKLKADLGVSYDNVATIAVYVLESDNYVKTSNSSDIKKIVKGLNSIYYYNSDDTQLGSSSPDAWAIMYDDKDERIDDLYFYGDIAMYKDKKYLTGRLTYSKLKSICKKYY